MFNKSTRPQPQRPVSADEQQGRLQLDRASSQPLPDALASSPPSHAGIHSALPVKALEVAGASEEADHARPAVRRRSAASAFSEDSWGSLSDWRKSKQLRLNSEVAGHHGSFPQAFARSASLCDATLQQRTKPLRQHCMSWPTGNVQLPLPVHVPGQNDLMSMPPQSMSSIADAFSLHLHQTSCDPQQIPLPPTCSLPQHQNDHQHSQPQQQWQHQPPQFLPLWESPQADPQPGMQDLSCVGGSDVLKEAALMFAADERSNNEGDAMRLDPLTLDRGGRSNHCSRGSMSPSQVPKGCGIPVRFEVVDSCARKCIFQCIFQWNVGVSIATSV